MSEEIRAAIIGTGFIGRVHARAARVAGARLVGVAASSPERSAAAAMELDTQPFDSAEAAIASDDVDVVHVCTPNHLHVPLATAALEAGKHVVLEKPVALSAAEAADLAELAQASDRVVSVPFVYRFYPTVREARERVRSGQLGDLGVLHGHYLQDWLTSPDDYNWRVDASIGGASRAFADIGSHWCDLVEFVSGHRIVRLVAHLHTTRSKRRVSEHVQAFGTGAADGEPTAVDTEDVATVLFTTDRGATGSVVISQVSPGRKNRLWFELDGTDGAVAFDQEHPDSVWLGDVGGARTLPRDPALLSPPAARLASLPGGHPQGYHDCFDGFVADTYAAIRKDVPDGLPTVVDGLRATRITDAVLASARTGTWVEVDT